MKDFKDGLAIGFMIGCAMCIGFHFFLECSQASLGHPQIQLSQGKASSEVSPHE
jgi:hypothetical protein